MLPEDYPKEPFAKSWSIFSDSEPTSLLAKDHAVLASQLKHGAYLLATKSSNPNNYFSNRICFRNRS
jgi:hypothetical protein